MVNDEDFRRDAAYLTGSVIIARKGHTAQNSQLRETAAMEKTVGAFEARRQFGQILKDVSARDESYVIEYHGEPVAAVVPIELYTKWKQRRDAFFEHMRATAARANLSPEEADKLIEEAIQAVRSER